MADCAAQRGGGEEVCGPGCQCGIAEPLLPAWRASCFPLALWRCVVDAVVFLHTHGISWLVRPHHAQGLHSLIGQAAGGAAWWVGSSVGCTRDARGLGPIVRHHPPACGPALRGTACSACHGRGCVAASTRRWLFRQSATVRPANLAWQIGHSTAGLITANALPMPC